LTMESTHSLDIKRDFNNIRDIEKKTFTLREFNGEAQNIDIIDPYYTSDETYRKIMKIIDNQVKQALKKIIQINNSI
ncbi:unnamed protein product, partial [marine sediment metagenome]